MKFAYLIEPPFNYHDDDGTVTGCDVELARYVFATMGIDSFEPIKAEFADLLPGVAAGNCAHDDRTIWNEGTPDRRIFQPADLGLA